MQYPESEDGGDLILKKASPSKDEPVDCMRVMLQKIRSCPRAKISSPEDVVSLMKEMGDYDRERSMILHLNVKNYVVGIENISTGSLNASIVHPREAIKGAVLNSSAHIIFVHNHPSGDPTPSIEDTSITRKLKSAFEAVGIGLLDSIIIGRGGKHYSYRKEGVITFKNGGIMESKEKNLESRDDAEDIRDDDMLYNPDDDDTCKIATRAAREVIAEKCGGRVHDVLSAADVAVRYIENNPDRFPHTGGFKKIRKIQETADGGWDVEIETIKYPGSPPTNIVNLHVSVTGEVMVI